MNYTLLTLIKRFNECESVGIMFKRFKDTLLAHTLEIKLWELFTTLYIKILAGLGVQWEIFATSLTSDDSILNSIKQGFEFLLEIKTQNTTEFA